MHNGAGGEADRRRAVDGIDAEEREPADVHVIYGDSGFDCADRVHAAGLFSVGAGGNAARDVSNISAAGNYRFQRARSGVAVWGGGWGARGRLSVSRRWGVRMML